MVDPFRIAILAAAGMLALSSEGAAGPREVYEACQIEVVRSCAGASDAACLIAGMDRCDLDHGMALWPMKDNQLRGPDRRPISLRAKAARGEGRAGGHAGGHAGGANEARGRDPSGH